jgi:hypothetical protein
LGAVAGPIGCFVLWRRMAYLGTSIAEMALLGAALGLLLGVDPLIGVLATSLARISHRIECIGDRILRKLFCENDLPQNRESPDADGV